MIVLNVHEESLLRSLDRLNQIDLHWGVSLRSTLEAAATLEEKGLVVIETTPKGRRRYCTLSAEGVERAKKAVAEYKAQQAIETAKRAAENEALDRLEALTSIAPEMRDELACIHVGTTITTEHFNRIQRLLERIDGRAS